MAVWWKSQEKDTGVIIFNKREWNTLKTCFYKANEAVVAEIYRFLRYIETQICYQQLVLEWEISVLNQDWVLYRSLLSNKGLIRVFLIIPKTNVLSFQKVKIRLVSVGVHKMELYCKFLFVFVDLF